MFKISQIDAPGMGEAWQLETEARESALPIVLRLNRWKRAFIAVAGLLALCAVGLLGVLLVRPALVMGFDGDALGRSLRAELGRAPHADCDRLESGDWTCTAFLRLNADDYSGSIPVHYVVSADSFGCWDGRETGAGASSTRNAPGRLHGCIDLWEI